VLWVLEQSREGSRPDRLILRAKSQLRGVGEPRRPGYAWHAGVLKAAVDVLFEATEWGRNVPLDLVWEAIEKTVGSWARLRAAVERVQESSPPPGPDLDGQWRAKVVERYATARGFGKMLCQVIEFGATADAQKVLTRDARSGWSAQCPAHRAGNPRATSIRAASRWTWCRAAGGSRGLPHGQVSGRRHGRESAVIVGEPTVGRPQPAEKLIIAREDPRLRPSRAMINRVDARWPNPRRI
jgi:hypothetical protein